ncbi:hypothetical protein, partial [Aquifex sp.]
ALISSIFSLLYLYTRIKISFLPSPSFLVKVLLSTLFMSFLIFLVKNTLANPTVEVFLIPVFGLLYFLFLFLLREDTTVKLIKYGIFGRDKGFKREGNQQFP